jgi:hypothetical protein
MGHSQESPCFFSLFLSFLNFYLPVFILASAS